MCIYIIMCIYTLHPNYSVSNHIDTSCIDGITRKSETFDHLGY